MRRKDEWKDKVYDFNFSELSRTPAQKAGKPSLCEKCGGQIELAGCTVKKDKVWRCQSCGTCYVGKKVKKHGKEKNCE